MWFRRRPREATGDEEQWVVIARFHPIANAADADLAVARLRGAGIPAVRFPINAAVAPAVGMMGPEPVRVLVPPERAEEARELLEEERSE